MEFFTTYEEVYRELYPTHEEVLREIRNTSNAFKVVTPSYLISTDRRCDKHKAWLRVYTGTRANGTKHYIHICPFCQMEAVKEKRRKKESGFIWDDI